MHSSRMHTAGSSSCSGREGGLILIPLNFPLGYGSESDPPQFTPWVWAWIWSPSISPLGVGLDLIPLNFPLGCGPGSDPPQFPPWVWVWTWSPSIFPLDVGLEGGLLGRGVSLAGGSPWQGGLLVRGVSLAGGSPSMHRGRPPCGQTHTCKNIAFANYVCGR